MKYPLVFQFTDEIRGASWSALVTLSGRCLVAFEDEAWWVEGVEPGGFSGSGVVPQAAMSDFRSTWSRVLQDLADESANCARFAALVKDCFAQTSEPARVEWDAARAAIRAGSATLEEPFSNLSRATGEFLAMVDVQESASGVPAAPDEFDTQALAA